MTWKPSAKGLLTWLLVAISAAAFFVLVYYFPQHKDAVTLYALLTFLTTLLLVIVNARYTFAFEKDAATRQLTQEEWERRRFIAGRIYAIADNLVDLYFGSKRELSYFLSETERLEKLRSELKAKFNPFDPRQYEQMCANVDADIASRLHGLHTRYNDLAKVHYARAAALLHQAKALLDPDVVSQSYEIFQNFSADFQTVDQGKAILAKYDELYDRFSGLIEAMHEAGYGKMAVREEGKGKPTNRPAAS